MKKLIKLFAFLVAVGLTTSASFATDGYFGLAYSARHKGLVGAGIALYHQSFVGSNPAGNVFLGTGYEINLGVFLPSRQYTVIGNPSMQPNTFGLQPGTVESESERFILPALAANWQLTDKDALGLAIYGNGGMNTDYPALNGMSTFFDPVSEKEDVNNILGAVSNETGVNLAQIFGELTIARKISEKHSFGVSGIVAFQVFEAKGLNSFGMATTDPSRLSNNGKDESLGFGFKIGYLGMLSDKFSVGATYQSKIFMEAFEEYKGLFAENGDFDIPSWFQVGVGITPVEKLTIAIDYKRIMYSDVAAVSNPLDPMRLFPVFLDENGQPQGNPNFLPLGGPDGHGFGWEDMDIFKLGLEYGLNENWILRGGYSYGQQPIPESEVLFNILAPGVIENHIGVGFSAKIGNPWLHFGFNYALNKMVSGANPLDPGQTIELEMDQFDVMVGVTF